MGLLDSFLGGGNDTAKTESAPWEKLQPYLTGDGGVYDSAQTLFNQGPQSFFDGQTYAGFDPLQTQAQNTSINYARSGLNGMMNPTMDSYKNVVSGNLMNAESNPYLQNNIKFMADQVKENAMTGAWSANDDAAVMSGNTGSSKYQLGRERVMNDVNETIAKNTNNMSMQGYNSGLNAMMNGMQMAPQMAQYGMAPNNIMNSIGGDRQAMNQAGINEDMARHDFDYNAGWDHLNNFNTQLQGNYMGSGTTGTQPVSSDSPLGGILGLASTGMGIYSGGVTSGLWGGE